MSQDVDPNKDNQELRTEEVSMNESEKPTDEKPPRESNEAAETPLTEGEEEEVVEDPEIQMEQRISELEDQLARSYAELANYRRRSANEAEQFRKYEGINLVRDLLPVVDNLKRAAEVAEQASDIENLKKGVEMVTHQFLETLRKYNVEQISAESEAFDPNQHEAVQQVPSEDVPAMHVLQELATGYRIHDRIVRPAKVIVSTGPGSTDEE